MGRTSDAKERLMKAVLELIWTASYGATTVDDICGKAGVRKGSFYHFFDSKSDLTVAALEADWQIRKPQLDSQFSPTLDPLQRLFNYCDAIYRRQQEQLGQCGHVLGCPFFSLGAEVCTQEERVRRKIQEILDDHRKYLESAIREAQVAGLIKASDPDLLSRMLFTYYEGVLTRARILNDIEVLKEMPRGTLELLAVTQSMALP